MKKRVTIIWMVQVALLSALATVLYYFPKFPLPIFPSILKVQFSMLPTIIGGFALGPIGGILICLIKFLFKLVTTHSAGIGEFTDLLIGVGVVTITTTVYKYNHTKRGAVGALLCGVLFWCLIAIVLNGFFAMPQYVKLYGIDAVVGMLKVIPGVTEENYLFKYLIFGCLPFNLMLSIVVSIVTYFVYKRVSWLFEKMDNLVKPKKQTEVASTEESPVEEGNSEEKKEE